MEFHNQIEEERQLKEESEFQDLIETVHLDHLYFSWRDLSNKGKTVHPSGKQRKIVQTIAGKLKFRKSTDLQSNSFREDSLNDFDLNALPRIFIYSGVINKREPDGILRKSTRRFLFLFNDIFLLTIKKDTPESYEVLQILWVKDLSLNHLSIMGEEDKFSLQLIINKTRTRQESRITFNCDNEESRRNWVTEIENILLAFHSETKIIKKIGWFHSIIRGTYYSAAYLGDHVLLRKFLKEFTYIPTEKQNNARSPDFPQSINSLDASGMGALHWSVLNGHEVCARLLLDRGADVDLLQRGLNTPLLLAAVTGQETIARLLIERGADVFARNSRDRDAVFMAVVYGHSSKGLPWVLQLLNSKGLDLNQTDSFGATPLHVCANKNLARPVKMLVDSGADVNAKHKLTQLTPLQMACAHPFPEVETIRSFLDKGAHPNWRDVQGRSAFDLVLSNQNATHSLQQLSRGNTNVAVDMKNNETSDKTEMASSDNLISEEDTSNKWRPMEETLGQVGVWAVRALPALLELAKKGGRFENKKLESLRPSFRAAVLEAKESWEKKEEPKNFLEFVLVREQSGEDLRLHKRNWVNDGDSPACHLCNEIFGFTNRRHHCRCCGVLCCSFCSEKKLKLSSMKEDLSENGYSPDTASVSTSPAEMGGNKKKKEKNSQERVCDGCFNRLLFEASQPSPDLFRVRRLKYCASELVSSIDDLLDSLEDPEGDPTSFQSSVRETIALTQGLDKMLSRGSMGFSRNSVLSPGSKRESFGFFNSRSSVSAVSPANDESRVDVLKLREAKLYKTEDIIAKFLEAADGYHRATKKLVEQKRANNRLWGAETLDI